MSGKLLVVLVSFAISSVANADLILGVRAGGIGVGFESVEPDKQPINFGVSVGYELGSFVRGLSVEAELTRTLAAGKVADTDLEVQSQGIYLTYATAGQLFVRGRIGVMDASVTAGDLSEDEGGETYGLAIGRRFENFLVELDYTSIDDDVSYASVAFKYLLKL